MSTPDVRFTLSAQGVAEVVSALKKIQNESKKTAEAPRREFNLLNGVLGNFKGLLAGVGTYLSARTLLNWARGSMEAADAQARLAESLGTTVERSSALSWVAAQSNVEVNALQAAFGQFNRRLAEFQAGSPGAIETFKDLLGLEVSDFKGKDLAESIDLVAQRVAQMEPGVQRNNVALELFGRSGLKLVPVLNQIGNEGLPAIIERGKELGTVLDSQTAAAAEALGDQMDTLKVQSQNLGASFVEGLAPDLQESLQLIGQDLADNRESIRLWGGVFGTVLNAIYAVVNTVLQPIINMFDWIGVGVVNTIAVIKGAIEAVGLLAKAAGAVVRGDTQTAGELAAAAKAATDRMYDEVEARADRAYDRQMKRLKSIGNSWADVFTRPPGAEANAPQIGPSEEELSAILKARLALERSALDNEIALFKAKGKIRNEQDRQAWEDGLLSVQEYFARRRASIESETAKEIATLERQRDLLSRETDDNKRATEEQKINAKIAQLRAGLTLDLLKLTGDERRAVEDLGEKRATIEARMLEAQGRRHEATVAAIAKEASDYDELLRQQGVSDDERLRRVEEFRTALTSVADFEELQRQAELALDGVELARLDIQNRVAAGLLSEVAGQREIARIELDRLPNLQAIGDALLAAAEATGDPEKVSQAQQWVAALGQLGLIPPQIDALTEALNNFDNNIARAGIDSLIDALAGVGRETENARQFFTALGMSAAQAIQQIIARMLVLQAIGGAFGQGGLDFLGFGVEKKAAGGLIRGPGGGTSDSILARISNGEFVMRSAVVSQPGMLGFLERVNTFGRAALDSMDVMRFAAGGYVGSAEQAAPVSRDGKMLLGLEDGLVMRALESPEGERWYVRTAARNRRALRRMLGS